MWNLIVIVKNEIIGQVKLEKNKIHYDNNINCEDRKKRSASNREFMKTDLFSR